MPLAPGTKIGPYEVISQVGAGGMGEVYRARDSRLRRDVAVKVLPAAFSENSDRLERFEREAQAAAALNHPNILSVYDVGVHNGSPYIVAELLEGETLREKLRAGAIPVRRAVDYSLQIAHGLAAAHEKGIIHRDLKPENLFITKDGRLKILDFGLAKLIEPEGAVSPSQATRSMETKNGIVLGTVGYMSPEQVRGQPADHRSDLFNVGVVIYEMLTGRRVFDGETQADVLSAILKEDPPELVTTGYPIPPGLGRLVHHCLEKDPGQRFQSTRDLGFALDAISGTTTSSQALAEGAGRKRNSYRATIVAALALAVGSGLGLVTGLRFGSNATPPSFHPLTGRRGTIYSARFAPDAQTIIYGARWEGGRTELFLTRPESPESRSEGIADSTIFAISSSGEMAVSLACRDDGVPLSCRGTLAKVPLGGGAPREIAEKVSYADWSPDGKNLAIVRRAEERIRLEFPIGKVLYETGGNISSPRVSPEGDCVAFVDHPTAGDDAGSVTLIDQHGNKRTLSSGFSSVEGLAWSPKGDELWFVAGIAGSPPNTLSAVTRSGKNRILASFPGFAQLQDVSRDGRVIITQSSSRGGIIFGSTEQEGGQELSWLDLSFPAALSADGKVLLFYEGGYGGGVGGSTYIRNTDGSAAVRLGEGSPQALSPDGKWVLSHLYLQKPTKLVLYPVGAGETRAFDLNGLEFDGGAEWLQNGNQILFQGHEPGQASRVYKKELPDGKPVASTPEIGEKGPVSPDGKFVFAYDLDKKPLLYPMDGDPPITVKGMPPGVLAKVVGWNADSRSLYVSDEDRRSARIYRLDPFKGQKQDLKVLTPPDAAGLMGFSNIMISPNGKSYVFGYVRVLGDLYLVEGLKY